MRLVKLVCMLVVVPAVARAQQWTNPFTGGTFNNPVSSYADTLIHQHIQRKILERSIAAQQGRAAEAGTGAQPVKVVHKPASASDFKPAKGRPAVDQFLATSGLDAEQRAAFKQVIDATFVAVERSLRKNNVATALGFAIATAVEIANGKEIAPADAKELIAGINDLLAASPEFVKLKASEKQGMYDSLILTGGLLHLLHAAGESDEAMKKASVDMAQSVLAQLTGSKTAN